jgi:CBS domain-containing protein
MVKAHIKTKNGTTIVVEGSHDEVARIMREYAAPEVEETASKPSTKPHKSEAGKSKHSVTDYVRELLVDGEFDKPIGIVDVKRTLESRGVFVPITTLSGVLLGLTRRKELRRMEENKLWRYVRR